MPTAETPIVEFVAYAFHGPKYTEQMSDRKKLPNPNQNQWRMFCRSRCSDRSVRQSVSSSPVSAWYLRARARRSAAAERRAELRRERTGRTS